ncbi:hypothetical protein BWQ96_03122 [Gracilariopsis chorda]|uniref:BRK domain-containing protein n=1 Tax=Gracilariopsis chorda TaxID=448386 RepID=A0A2V3IYA3_9FLOR|nr:hypothetical protein BWQ96_03122 [Gracilariopsis chorda]|eukprot:PXF47045.1 hypothetical protein BWQ96_03122 [Gracilariopsis chorda]
MNSATPSAPSSRESAPALSYSSSVCNVPNQRELNPARANTSNPDFHSTFTRFRLSPHTTPSTTPSPLLTRAASIPRTVQGTNSLNEPPASSGVPRTVITAAPSRKTAIPPERSVTILKSMHNTTTGLLTTKSMPSKPVSRPSPPTCNPSALQQPGVPSPTVVNALPFSVQRPPSALYSRPANAPITLTADNAVTKLIESNEAVVNVASTSRQPYHSESKQPRIGQTIHATSLNQTETRSPSQATTQNRPTNETCFGASRLPTSSQTTRKASRQPTLNAMQAVSIQRASYKTVNAAPSKVQMVNSLTGQSGTNHNANTAVVNVASNLSGFSTLADSASMSTASATQLTGLASVANAGGKHSIANSMQFYLVPSKNNMNAVNDRSSRANPSGGVGPGKPVPHPGRSSQGHNRMHADVKGVPQTSAVNGSSCISSRYTNRAPTASISLTHGSRRAQNAGIQAITNTSKLGTQIMRGNNPSPPALSTSGLPVTHPSRTQSSKSREGNAVQRASRLQTSTAPQPPSAAKVTMAGERRLPLLGPVGTQRTEIVPTSTNATAIAGATKLSFCRMRTATSMKNQSTITHDNPALQVCSLLDSRTMPGAKGATACVNTGNGRRIAESGTHNMRGRSTSDAKTISMKISTDVSKSQLTPTKRLSSVSSEILAASVKRSRPSPPVPKTFASARSPASVTHGHTSQQIVGKSAATPALQSQSLAVLPEMQHAENSRISIGMRFNDMEHVRVWNREEKRKIAGNAAPLGKNIERYLREHQECEVYTGQDISDKQERKASGLQYPSALSAGDHVTVWNRVEKRKIAGNAAPLVKNLEAYLRKNPNCEVYNLQDRRHGDGGIRIQVHSNDNISSQDQRGQLAFEKHGISANKLPRSGHSQSQVRAHPVRQYEGHTLVQAPEVSSSPLSQNPAPFF